jgi:capsular polysaccharide biosynthesis protein
MQITRCEHFNQVDSIERLVSSASDTKFEVQPTGVYRAPGLRFLGDATYQHPSIGHGKVPAHWNGKEVSTPDLSIYMLHECHAFGGRILSRTSHQTHASGQLLLRDTYSIFSQSYGIMDGILSLPSDLISTESGDSFRLKLPASQPQRLDGTYVFIGSMHSHFGHTMLEGLARLWIIPKFKDLLPDNLRFLVYEPAIPPYARALLNYLGISDEQIMHCSEHSLVERLIVPGCGMRTHVWVRDEQNHTWNAIAERAAKNYPTNHPDKVFLSRADIQRRILTNSSEIEEIFRSHGYTIAKPEQMRLGHQIAAAHAASSIAGCVGSNMYLAAFQKRGGRNIVLAPCDFYLKDDAMIAGLRNSNLTVVLGSPTDGTREQNWTIDASLVSKALLDDPHDLMD